jgi:hypothetical protein
LSDSFEIKLKSAFRNPKSAILLCAMLFALSFPVEAQQPKKVTRIGYLRFASVASVNPLRIDAFRLGLHQLGYT